MSSTKSGNHQLSADVEPAADYSSVAVLVPCYNEAVTIAKVIDDFRAALPGAAIYVYDNNSTDLTALHARAAGAAAAAAQASRSSASPAAAAARISPLCWPRVGAAKGSGPGVRPKRIGRATPR